jgi:transposase
VITVEEERDALREELRLSQEKIAQLIFQLEQIKRLIYGSKSERFVPSDPSQATLFGVEASAAPPTEEVSYTRVAIAAHLPRIEQVIEPEDLPGSAERIGEEITETLQYTPAVIEVHKLVRPRYVHEERILIAPLPSQPFPKSNLGASLAAHIAVSKFCDHIPLCRQRSQLKRAGLEVSDSTIGGWFQATATLLEPLGDALKNEVLAQDYLQVDESPIPVQQDHQEGALRTGYHWVYHAPLIKTVLFDYRPGRSAEFPTEVLKGFQGTLQTDGYAGYEKLAARADITALACMAHARRYFDKALTNDKGRAEHALGFIGELYRIERHCQDQGMDPDQRKAYRQSRAAPMLDQLETWLKEQVMIVVPKSPIGTAIAYALSLWPRLCAYITEGRYLIDNPPYGGHREHDPPPGHRAQELSLRWQRSRCSPRCPDVLPARHLQAPRDRTLRLPQRCDRPDR